MTEDQKPGPTQIIQLQGAIACIKSKRILYIQHSLTSSQGTLSILEAKETCYNYLVEGKLRLAVQTASDTVYRMRSGKIEIGKVEDLLRELYRKSEDGMCLEDARSFIDIVLV